MPLVPSSPLGAELVRWTIYATLVLYVAALALMIGGLRSAAQVPTTWRWTRRLWTLGWLIFVVHVALAFDVYHGWSHTAAMEHVQRASGFGPGIFVSYSFTLLWGTDVAWWWLAPKTRDRRPVWLGFVLHAFMAFIMFNGAVIFESGPSRWFGLAATAFLLWWIWRATKNVTGVGTWVPTPDAVSPHPPPTNRTCA